MSGNVEVKISKQIRSKTYFFTYQS